MKKLLSISILLLAVAFNPLFAKDDTSAEKGLPKVPTQMLEKASKMNINFLEAQTKNRLVKAKASLEKYQEKSHRCGSRLRERCDYLCKWQEEDGYRMDEEEIEMCDENAIQREIEEKNQRCANKIQSLEEEIKDLEEFLIQLESLKQNQK